MMPKGLANPRHSVDFQSTVLDENDWKGQLVFKIPKEEKRES